MEKRQINQHFQDELAKLNDIQRAAVEQIEGPVLVIAGPGTGKTQILSARIGNILAQTDAQPHNILCLTYTEAGTIAMRKRLLKFIGPDAHRVHIFTFHAFCNQVIQDNLEIFGYRDLQPVSELESLQIFRKLIDSFEADHPLKRYTGDTYYDTKRLQVLYDSMKKEAWSIEYLENCIRQYIESLPDRAEFIYKRSNSTKGIKAGDVNTAKLEKEKAEMEKLLAAVKGYTFIEHEMTKVRRYDYNDMVLWVLNEFRTNENLLTTYQEKYQYFLVDEYQDTNGAQNEILNLITSYWEAPNVFVVGDDDQAIYRFQGANISNIIDFYNHHQQHIKLFLMKENYRSVQSILDAAGALIVNNEERLVNKLEGLDKELICSNPVLKQYKSEPVITEYYNTLHEEADIVEKLESMCRDGQDLSEVAVIYRNHRIIENIIKVLERKGIPVNIKQKINILDLPLIKCIANILFYLKEEFEEPNSREDLLYEIMHYPFFGISPRDIAVINKYCRSNEEKRRKSWREVIASRETLFKLNLETARAISIFEENITAWIAHIPSITVQALFEKILTRGGIITWILKNPEKEWNMQLITTFFDFIKEESARNKFVSLSDITHTLELMISNSIPLYLNKILHNEKGVNFITAHSSKGLEFETVFLISATSSSWDKGSRRSTFKLPDTVVETDEDERAEDERRLFYVAMTRAKKKLYISYSAKKVSEKEEEATRFVAEVLASAKVKLQKVSVSDNILLSYQKELMSEQEIPEISFLDESFIKDELKDYKMSVTHLNKYLKCPLSFYFENVLKVPSARNENIGFGNAVHYALFNFFLKMQQSEEKEFAGANVLVDLFAKGMEIYHSHFTKKDFENRLEYGKRILPSYYNCYVSNWNKIVKLEFRITHCIVEGVPITGALDKIEFDGKLVNVVDYKTGNPEKGKAKLLPPSEKDPMGGEYWRQIVFYKLLLDHDKSTNYTMASGEIDFIQPGNREDFIKRKVIVTPEDVQTVKSQIRETYDKIMNLEFKKGCGKDDCSWCNFVKYNYNAAYLPVSETTEEEE